MRRKATLALATVFLLCGFGAYAEQESATERILSDWVNLIYMQEDRCTQENYTLDLIIQFCDDPTWENLVRARTATGFTLDLLEYYAEQAFDSTATDEDYAAVIDGGIDIGDAQNTVAVYNTIIRPDIEELGCAMWRNFQVELMYYAFDVGTTRNMKIAAQRRKSRNEGDMREWYLMTSYMIIELPEEDAENLTRLMKEYTPAIMAMYDKPFEDINDMMNEYNKIVKQSEEELIASSEALTMSYDDLENIPDLEPLSVKNMPTMLPYLPCMTPEECEFVYYWKGEDGEIEVASRLMDIQTLPNCFNITIPDVEYSEYLAYVMLLADEHKLADINDTAALFEFDNGASLVIVWDQSANSMQINVSGGQICFAPIWYIEEMAAHEEKME